MMSWHSAGEAEVGPGTAWLTPVEASRAASMRFTKRRSEWLLARWTAKHTVAAALGLHHDERSLRRIEVGVVLLGPERGAPEVSVDGIPAPVGVAMTDRAGWAVCAVAAGVRIGCDLELDEPRSDAFVRTFLTPAEQALVADGRPGLGRDALANLVWSAKESALKVLRTGLRRDTRSVEVTLAEDQAPGWNRLTVRTEEGAVLPGWWQGFGPFLLTVAADTDHAPPEALVAPPPLASAVPVHSWVDRPLADASAPQRSGTRTAAGPDRSAARGTGQLADT